MQGLANRDISPLANVVVIRMPGSNPVVVSCLAYGLSVGSGQAHCAARVQFKPAGVTGAARCRPAWRACGPARHRWRACRPTRAAPGPATAAADVVGLLEVAEV